MSALAAASSSRSGRQPDLTALDFQVLGPLAVYRSGQPIALGGPKQRLVLALLVLDANRVLSADRIIEQVWGDEPPDAARGTLQAYVSRLRKALGPGSRIEARAPGYVLKAGPDEVDASRFDRLVNDGQGRLAADPRAAKSLLDAALALWHGPALDDLAAEEALRASIARLEERRLTAIEAHVEARLALGEHAEVVAELERLVAEHPLREPFASALMLALYRSDRQAEALSTYERTRLLVADELGSDPSPGLRRLHEQILKQDPALSLKGRSLRGYELLDRIGEGSFGVVYRAVQPSVRRDVAVKVIHRALANQPEFIRRFEQEAQLVGRLEHPQIVPLYDYWRDPEGAYLVMRHLRGGSLAQRLDSSGPLTAAEAGRLVEQVCSALSFAHRQGVVHRDVRPSNILFDEEGNAYLSDFGIAVEVAVAETLSRRYGVLAGYLAPEEIRSEPISAATDVYGLGLTIHEALTGRHAYAGSPSAEMIERQLTAPTPAVNLARPDLPDAVGAVIATATAKDPAARHPDAAAFASAFAQALASEAPSAAAAPPLDRNPYKGLRAFDEADAADFFGREALTEQLVGRLSETGPGHRFLAVVGPSGSGKSSTVRAGLVPALRRGEVAGSASWFVVEMHPGAEPFRELESALMRVATRHPPNLADALEWSERGLQEAADQILPPDGSELLIIVDQFEELFTLVPDDARRNAFMTALADAALDRASRVRVLITLRADFYDRPLLHPGFGNLLAARTQALTAMSSDDLERAIVVPARSAGVTFESGLVGAVVSDVAHEPGSLPLLQYALTELFDQRQGSALSLETYRRMGGISGAVSRRAEDLYHRLDEPAKRAARQLFLRLVTLGDVGSGDSRRRVLRTELAAMDVNQAAIDRVMEVYGAHRFLTFDRDPATRGQTVEVAHEALLESWRRLRGWIDSGREDLRAYRRLAAGAAEWEAAGRDASFLLRGSRLDQFESWAQGTHLAMSGSEREYLDVSQAATVRERAEEEARQRREALLSRRALNRLRAGVAILLVGAVAAAGLAVVAQQRGARAELEARIATARQLAAAATAMVNVNADRALQLALQAVETTKGVDGTTLPEAEQALHAAVQADRVLVAAPGHRAAFSADGKLLLIVGERPGRLDVRDATTGRLITRQAVSVGDYAPETGAPLLAITPDGTRFVTGGRVHGMAVFDSATGKLHSLLGRFCCGQVWITPDGRSVVAVENQPCGAGVGWATFVFDIEDGRQLNCFSTAGIWAFSPDSRRAAVATGSGGGSTQSGPIYVGDLHAPGGGKTIQYDGQSDVNGIAWSADGSTLATSSPSRVMLWNPTRAGPPVVTLVPPSSTFSTVAFGIEPSLLATGMSDGSVILWRLSGAAGTPILRLAGHGGVIRSVAFHPDSRRMVTGSDDGLVKVWDISPRGGGELLSLAGGGNFAFSRDGHSIATGSADGHVRVFDASSGRTLADLAAHTSPVEAVSFGSNRGTIVSAAADGTVFSAVSGGTVLTEPHSADTGVSFAINPAGTLLALPLGDQTVALVDPKTDTQVGSIFPEAVGTRDVEAYPNSYSFTSSRFGQTLVFSRDGAMLAVAGGFAGCWISRPDGALLADLNTADLDAVAFSPDGRRVVTVDALNEGGTVRVWGLTHFGVLIGVLPGHSPVTSVAFSPDGSTLVTSGTDGAVRLWDAATLQQRVVLATDADGMVAFSPDGTRLAYVAGGGVIRVLALRIDDLIALAKAKLVA